MTSAARASSLMRSWRNGLTGDSSCSGWWNCAILATFESFLVATPGPRLIAPTVPIELWSHVTFPHTTCLQQSSRNAVTNAAMLNVEEGVTERLVPRQIATPNSEQLLKSLRHNVGRGSGEAAHDYRVAKLWQRPNYGCPCSITGPLGTVTPPTGSTVISKWSGWAMATGTISAVCPTVST